MSTSKFALTVSTIASALSFMSLSASAAPLGTPLLKVDGIRAQELFRVLREIGISGPQLPRPEVIDAKNIRCSAMNNNGRLENGSCQLTESLTGRLVTPPASTSTSLQNALSDAGVQVNPGQPRQTLVVESINCQSQLAVGAGRAVTCTIAAQISALAAHQELEQSLPQGRYTGLEGCQISADHMPFDRSFKSTIAVRNSSGQTASIDIRWVSVVTYMESKAGFLTLNTIRKAPHKVEDIVTAIAIQKDRFGGLTVRMQQGKGNVVQCSVKR